MLTLVDGSKVEPRGTSCDHLIKSLTLYVLGFFFEALKMRYIITVLSSSVMVMFPGKLRRLYMLAEDHHTDERGAAALVTRASGVGGCIIRQNSDIFAQTPSLRLRNVVVLTCKIDLLRRMYSCTIGVSGF